LHPESKLFNLNLRFRIHFFKVIYLFLKGFALVLFRIQLGQSLVDLVLKLAFQRLLFKIVLIDEVRKLSLSEVSILPQNSLDLFLLCFVGLMLPN